LGFAFSRLRLERIHRPPPHAAWLQQVRPIPGWAQLILSRCFIAVGALVSVLQGIFFTLQGASGTISGLGLTLAVLAVLAVWRWHGAPNMRIVLTALRLEKSRTTDTRRGPSKFLNRR